MRLEYWAHIRFKGNSFYVTIPKDEMYKLWKEHRPEQLEDLIGKEVKVEVTL